MNGIHYNMRRILVAVRCSNEFNGGRMYEAMRTANVLNVIMIIWQYIQILLLMYPIWCFFLHELWYHTLFFVFYSKIMNRTDTILKSFFMYFQRGKWQCRVWMLILGHPVFLNFLDITFSQKSSKRGFKNIYLIRLFLRNSKS